MTFDGREGHGVWAEDPPEVLQLFTAAADHCPALQSLALAAWGDSHYNRSFAKPLPEHLSALSRVTALALHGALLTGVGPLAALTALRQLSLVDCAPTGEPDGEALRHSLSALTNLHTLQVRSNCTKCCAADHFPSLKQETGAARVPPCPQFGSCIGAWCPPHTAVM